MKTIFNSIRVKKPQKSFFDLTHDVKMSGNMGDLMPCLCMDVLPGDKIDLGADIMVRTMPMLAPIMHRVDVYVHYFFVPNRILWPQWEMFISGAWRAPDTFDEPVPPYIDTADFGASPTGAQWRFADYLGLPPNTTLTVFPQINALPFAAYNKIFADWYADQNYSAGFNPDGSFEGALLSDALVPDVTVYKIRQRAWEHDRFTSALPWAQKGEDVIIPQNELDRQVFRKNGSTSTYTGAPNNMVVAGGVPNNPNVLVDRPFAKIDPDGNPTINDLRRATALQRWLEKNARGGTRYIESILSNFGVRSSDARLQRSEYICGLKTPLIISDIPSTADSVDADSNHVPQGTLAGKGTSISGGSTGTYFCEEHGWIMGIVSVLPKPAYQQGIDKKFSRFDPLDYAWPDFAHLGEEPILRKEIFAYTSGDDNVWGYTPRYSDYKYMYSRVAGEFRTSLNFWHLGRIFSSAPAMGDDFLRCDAGDAIRIFPVQDDSDKLLFHVLNRIGAYRPLPKYGTPI